MRYIMCACDKVRAGLAYFKVFGNLVNIFFYFVAVNNSLNKSGSFELYICFVLENPAALTIIYYFDL